MVSQAGAATVRSRLNDYRPDIDGLRALAIVIVVAYHAFPKTAHGGFIGVDVFFVISGFLITSLIAEAIGKGRFSFREFYARRIRRIFPALAVTLAGCLAIGALFLDPAEYKLLGLQVAAGAGFLSNALFWSQAGYFDQAAEFKPLLHLWSLAVEEQFYIIWPLALYLCARLRRPLWAMAVAAAAASFALNLYLAEVDQVADFYFVLSRLWELLIGAALALGAPDAFHGRPKLANAAAALGLALIATGLLTTYSSQAFPGWRALAPTLGAGLLIAAGPGALVNARWLATRPMVTIGKISYPLYLWHWPLLAFARIREGGETPPAVRWELIAVAIVLAQLTYVYVERPIRFGPRPSRRTGVAAAAVAALALIGLWDARAGGLFWPNWTLTRVANQGDVGQTEFTDYLAAHAAPCDMKLFPPFAKHQKGALSCGQSIADVSPEIVLLGDSHAEHLFLGVAETLPRRNVAWYLGDGLPTVDDPLFATVYTALAADAGVRTVVLSASWKGRLRFAPSGFNLRVEMDRAVRLLLAAGKKVYVANDVPSFRFQAGRCKYAGRLGLPQICDESEAALDTQLSAYEDDLAAAVAANPGAQLVDTAHMLCREGVCSMAEAGKLLYRDTDHLNINGSLLIGAKLLAAAPGIAE